jgi:hypothetical protein
VVFKVQQELQVLELQALQDLQVRPVLLALRAKLVLPVQAELLAPQDPLVWKVLPEHQG